MPRKPCVGGCAGNSNVRATSEILKKAAAIMLPKPKDQCTRCGHEAMCHLWRAATYEEGQHCECSTKGCECSKFEKLGKGKEDAEEKSS